MVLQTQTSLSSSLFHVLIFSKANKQTHVHPPHAHTLTLILNSKHPLESSVAWLPTRVPWSLRMFVIDVEHFAIPVKSYPPNYVCSQRVAAAQPHRHQWKWDEVTTQKQINFLLWEPTDGYTSHTSHQCRMSSLTPHHPFLFCLIFFNSSQFSSYMRLLK